ncbi:hypothetical protein L9G16_01015 [Shewanella sp. A25]|nr:hypothetical protein [Shewanella shenzhenensis]
MNFEIGFTGFKSEQRALLERIAHEHSLTVRKTVSKTLHFLCLGPNAGPSKIELAKQFGTITIDENTFHRLVNDGELAVTTAKSLLALVDEQYTSPRLNQNHPNDTTPLNEDGQPVARFNEQANIERSLNTLKGILLGITADQRLRQSELLLLDVWIKNHEEITDDPDIVDLADALNDILADGVVTADELEDLFELINSINDYRQFGEFEEHHLINQLLGFLSGIAADDEINESEILTLVDWLNQNSAILDCWPASTIVSKLNAILADGEITFEEREELLQTIQKLTGVHLSETGDCSSSTTECFDQIDTLQHHNIGFCFTGKFNCGSRKEVEAKATNLGAFITKGVNFETRYLVIGAQASRDWKFSSHGRKIEKAMNLKGKGHDIFVISEEQWKSHI